MKNHHIFFASLLIGCSLALASCSDDEVKTYRVNSALAVPQGLTLQSATTSSLSFTWDLTPDAVLYGYELLDAQGQILSGGTTKEPCANFSGLELFTAYTLRVVAMPAVGRGQGISTPQTLVGRTLFYEPLADATTIYTSYLRDAVKGHTYNGTISEDRDFPGYQEGWFGNFTIKGFYGATGDLTFRVNRDYTITVLHADYTPLAANEYDENGWAKVLTGIAIPSSQKTLYIDESSSVFDPLYATLTYTARLGGGANTEVIDW